MLYGFVFCRSLGAAASSEVRHGLGFPRGTQLVSFYPQTSCSGVPGRRDYLVMSATYSKDAPYIISFPVICLSNTGSDKHL